VRFYGRYHVSTTLYLDGKVLIFIKDGYANFTKGKEYPVTAERYNNGKVKDYRIIDDDGDSYPIGEGDVGRKFSIKN